MLIIAFGVVPEVLCIVTVAGKEYRKLLVWRMRLASFGAVPVRLPDAACLADASHRPWSVPDQIPRGASVALLMAVVAAQVCTLAVRVAPFAHGSLGCLAWSSRVRASILQVGNACC